MASAIAARIASRPLALAPDRRCRRAGRRKGAIVAISAGRMFLPCVHRGERGSAWLEWMVAGIVRVYQAGKSDGRHLEGLGDGLIHIHAGLPRVGGVVALERVSRPGHRSGSGQPDSISGLV